MYKETSLTLKATNCLAGPYPLSPRAFSPIPCLQRMDLAKGSAHGRVLIREFDRNKDTKMVEKLEKNCEMGSTNGLSILTSIMGDPLRRVRHYRVHVMLVAELVGDGEVVGVVRGCMKYVGTGVNARHVKIGCILGLRVSPKHRRIGIGMLLVRSVEDWAIRNEAQNIFLATEENNIASINLFVHKCGYVKISSLAILVQPMNFIPKKSPSPNAKVEKLSIEQTLSLYKDKLGGKKFFPMDIDAILRDKLSLGTWMAYFEEDEGFNAQHEQQDGGLITWKTPSSWAILSIWKTYEAYNIQIREDTAVGCLHTLLNDIGSKVLTWFASDMVNRPLGFLFLYGLHGEGQRVGDLMVSLWYFVWKLVGKEKDCKVVVTELGLCDPLLEHVPREYSTSHISDLWFMKGVDGVNGDSIQWAINQPLAQLFVDPRDF